MIKLKPRKFYITRDGRQAYIAAIGSPYKDTWEYCEALGWLNDDELMDNHWRWNRNGKSTISSSMEGLEEGSDLIAEWIIDEKC